MLPRYPLLLPPVRKNPTLRIRCGFGRALTGHRRIRLRYPDVGARSATTRIENRGDGRRSRNHGCPQPPCIFAQECAEKSGTGRVSSEPPRPSEAVVEQDATRPDTRSKARTVDGAAHRRARIKTQGGVTASAAAVRRTAMGVNAAIDVGKHEFPLCVLA